MAGLKCWLTVKFQPIQQKMQENWAESDWFVYEEETTYKKQI